MVLTTKPEANTPLPLDAGWQEWDAVLRRKMTESLRRDGVPQYVEDEDALSAIATVLRT